MTTRLVTVLSVTSSNIGNKYNGKYGVITDIDVTYEYPYCVKLDDGSYDGLWSTVTDDNPLTLEELKQMDGQKVWCSVVLESGERFSEFSTVGWYTVNVKEERLEKDGGHYSFEHYGVTYGFRPYRTDQSHRANEEELPF